MSDTRKLKVSTEPSFINKEMVIGTLYAPGIGTIVGGLLGKERMRREKEVGKTVSDQPSIFNKDMLLGAELGSFIGAAIGALVGLALAGPVGAVLGFQVGAGLGVITGGIVGGKNGQTQELAEFAQAGVQQSERGINQAISRSRDQEPRDQQREFTPTLEQERSQNMLHVR